MRVAWVAVLGVACLARAESLSLSVASGTRCVTESSLRQQLTRAGLVVAQSGELDVDVSSSPDGAVRLRARRGRDARLLVRTLPVRSTCEGLELALVTLIREWATGSALVTLDAGLPSRSEGLDARMTRSDAGVTRSDAAMTRSDAATTRSDAAMTRSDAAMTRSDAATTRSDAGVTRSDSMATRSDAGVMRTDSGATRGDAGAEGRDLVATRGDVGADGRDLLAPRGDAGVTRTDSPATRGDVGADVRDLVTTRGAGATGGDASSATEPARGDSETLRRDAGATVREAASAGKAAAAAGDSGRDAGGTDGEAASPRGELGATPTTLTDTTGGDAGVAPDGSTVPWEVRFAFAGGVTALIDAPVSPSGSALLDVGPSALGASLEGAFDANVTLAAEGGTLTFNSQSVTLSARWRFAWDRLSLDLGVGVRGFRISATPAGFTTNTPATLFSAGPAVSATLWVRLAGPLQLVVRGATALRFPADQLNILNGPTFRLGPWQVGAVAGLALAWP